MSSSGPSNTPDAPSRRRKRKDYSLLVLAAGIFLFGAAAAGLYYILQPVTLRIAVGPAGSDDQKLVQALAQTFARDGSAVRLHPIVTDGAIESIALLAANKADLAVARGDLDLPADAQSVAILRKNVVVLWSVGGLPAKGAKKPPAPKIKELGDLAGHRVGVIGRTKTNVTLLRVILTESGVNPDKVAVTQFATTQIAEMARDPSIEAFMAVGPLDSKITIEAIAATAKARGEPNSCRSRSRRRSPRNTRSTKPRRSPAAPSVRCRRAPRQDRYRQRQPPDHRAEDIVGYRGRRLRPAIVHRAPVTGPGKCPRQPRSRSRIPTRTPRCRRIRVRRPISTAMNVPSLKNTPTMSGAQFWFSPASDPPAPGCVITGSGMNANNTPSIATICSPSFPRCGWQIHRRTDRHAKRGRRRAAGNAGLL